MATPLHAVPSTLDVLPHADVLSSLAWDSMITFGLAGVLITATVAVLALLPWTDQQIASTDDEARTLLQHVQTRMAGTPSPRVAVVSRAS